MFDDLYKRVMEQNVAGNGGVFGTGQSTTTPDDGDYAAGDNRLPKVLGPVQTRFGPRKVRRKKSQGPLK